MAPQLTVSVSKTPEVATVAPQQGTSLQGLKLAGLVIDEA
jgi:hypothetical protein